jgi:hypothetical protein
MVSALEGFRINTEKWHNVAMSQLPPNKCFSTTFLEILET